MKTALIFAVLMSALLPTVSAHGTAIEFQDIDPASVDVVECRLNAQTYNGFAMDLMGQNGIAGRRNWKEIKSANLFMAEYELPAPIVVAGRYSTRRIAFTTTGMVAMLDVPDPAVVAKTAGIAGTTASGPTTDGPKFLGERVITNVTDPVKSNTVRARTVIIRSVTNVTLPPSKTLHGCSYWIDPVDKDGKPL